MDRNTKGKTLWEMLLERLHKNSDGEGIAFANPKDLRIESLVNVPYANGPEFAGYDFGVQEIREYNRQIGGQEFRFTDYVLKGINTKSFEAEGALIVRLRVVPNVAGSNDSLLLRLYDEFAFAEDFLAVLKDDTGILEVEDEEGGEKETFTRINDLRTSCEAAVLSVQETTPDGRAATGRTSPAKMEYWDYWRDVELAGGKTAQEFIFAELNFDTGWFQLWRGREFFG